MLKPITYEGQSATQLFGVREQVAIGVEETVKAIIEDVRVRGDVALREYAEKFDGFTGSNMRVSDAEFEEAERALSHEYISMLKRAIENIKEFHSKQKREGFEINDGNRIVGQKFLPIERVGLYVPGGTAALSSTVLMNAVPAKIAGVGEIILTTPAKSDGKIKPEVLVAARLCGVDSVFKVGGAQAIAALAYGTESVPKVDKITGPGNIYVATAKRLVSGSACGIDMVAGPSEVLVVADSGANAEHVAADMLSQAEHDALAAALLICDSANFANSVAAELEKQVELLPRADIARKSLENNCKIIVADSISVAVRLANEYAPEHLELCVQEPFALLSEVKNAGSVFLGYNTPEAVGDYYAGANHTLPTCGTARFSSPLGVDDFVKAMQYIYYTESALDKASSSICMFAESEGLSAHARSVSVRTGNKMSEESK